jgi:hypothetical protein
MCSEPINHYSFQSACNISDKVAERFLLDSTPQTLGISLEPNLRTEAHKFRT